VIPTECWVLPRPRRDCYVGSFPLHFEQKLVKRVAQLQGRGDWEYGKGNVLHPFGGLSEIGDSVDLNATTTPTWVGDAHNMDWIADNTYDLVVLDPPYSDRESEELYGTPKLKPGKFTAEAVRVCRVGGHVAVYHVTQPRRPKGTRLVHRIVVLTRTGHKPRVCFIFEKLETEGSAVIQGVLPDTLPGVRQVNIYDALEAA
jgi:hypothetical protein